MDEASELLRQVRWLGYKTRDLCVGTPDYPAAEALISSLDSPLRLLVMGRTKVGKSTMVNALIGEEVAATAPELCTRVFTTYQWGPVPKATLQLNSDRVHSSGDRIELSIDPTSRPVHVDIGDLDLLGLDSILIEWPAERLRTVTLVDSPGIELWGRDSEDGKRSSTDLALHSADAILHMLGHLHASAPDLVEDLSRSAAIPTGGLGRILVLARADELGGAGLDAMETAERIAKRYTSDDKIHRICQSVLPLAALAAQGAMKLDDGDRILLQQLAELPEAQRESMLISADRVAKKQTGVSVSTQDRARLVEYLGLYGVRLAIEILRAGTVSETADLSSEILRSSGRTSLVDAMDLLFVRRLDALKSQRALREIKAIVTNAQVTGSRGLLRDIERIEVGAHTFQELRLLDSIRSGAIPFSADQADAERILGEAGDSLTTRLGLPPDADGETISQSLIVQLNHWHRFAEAPNAPEEVRNAARVLIRTCEGLLAGLAAKAPGI